MLINYLSDLEKKEDEKLVQQIKILESLKTSLTDRANDKHAEYNKLVEEAKVKR